MIKDNFIGTDIRPINRSNDFGEDFELIEDFFNKIRYFREDKIEFKDIVVN